MSMEEFPPRGSAGAAIIESPDEPAEWESWQWVSLVAAVVMHSLVMAVATAFISLDTAGVCREPAIAGDLARARVSLMVVVALSVGPWLPALIAACRRRRRRTRFVVALLTVALLPAWTFGSALLATPADWTMDWCLF